MVDGVQDGGSLDEADPGEVGHLPRDSGGAPDSAGDGDRNGQVVLRAEVVDEPSVPSIHTGQTATALTPLFNDGGPKQVVLAQSPSGVTVDSRSVDNRDQSTHYHQYGPPQPTAQLPQIVVRIEQPNPWLSPPVDKPGKPSDEAGPSNLQAMLEVLGRVSTTRRGLWGLGGALIAAFLAGGSAVVFMNWTPEEARKFREKFNRDLNVVQRKIRSGEMAIERASDPGNLAETADGPNIEFAIEQGHMDVPNKRLYCGRAKVLDDRGAVARRHVYNIDRLPDGSFRVSEVLDGDDGIGMAERVFVEDDPNVLGDKLYIVNADRVAEHYTPWDQLFEEDKVRQKLLREKAEQGGKLVSPRAPVAAQKP